MSLPTSESPESHLHSGTSLLSHNDYDDDDTSSTTSSLHKGFQQDDFAERKRGWWTLGMPLRARRTSRRVEVKASDAELDSLYSRRKAKRRGWFNYCVFGGISGLSILAFLLLTNLTLFLLTALYTPSFDPLLSLWGTPHTGTAGLSWYPTDFTRDVLPIPCHSHNDYWRRVPLFSALRAGCISVEADVWLFDDDLYVGHNTASLTRNRTFSSLYIDPLVKILQDQNPSTEFYNGTKHGVYDEDPAVSLTLLVDVKTSGAETWPWVLAQLEPLRERGWLTFVENGVVNKRPVTVVGTGNTPFDVLTQNTTYRDAFFDAPLDTMWEPRHPSSRSSSSEEEDDDEDTPPPTTPLSNVGQGLSGTTPQSSFNESNSFYASVSFNQAVGRIWRGRLSKKQIRTIRGQVRGAHKRGLRARYWDTPAWPLGLRGHVWEVLVREGVDVLSVDDLRGVGRLSW